MREGGGGVSYLPAVELEPQPQLLVVDHRVSPHVLLRPDAVGQSLLQPGHTHTDVKADWTEDSGPE